MPEDDPTKHPHALHALYEHALALGHFAEKENARREEDLHINVGAAFMTGFAFYARLVRNHPELAKWLAGVIYDARGEDDDLWENELIEKLRDHYSEDH